jgi:hypothetical protein
LRVFSDFFKTTVKYPPTQKLLRAWSMS